MTIIISQLLCIPSSQVYKEVPGDYYDFTADVAIEL